MVQHVVHLGDAFAHREPADGEAVEVDFRKLREAPFPQILEEPALVDAEEQLPVLVPGVRLLHRRAQRVVSSRDLAV